jgi:hypothetical protein
MTTALQGFPALMKNPANRIAQSNQATPGVEGYLFDGRDGSQMAFWTCSENAVSAQHVHDYDEYMAVVQGCYTLIINGDRIPLMLQRNISFSAEWRTVGKFLAGTRRSTHLVVIELSVCRVPNSFGFSGAEMGMQHLPNGVDGAGVGVWVEA